MKISKGFSIFKVSWKGHSLLGKLLFLSLCLKPVFTVFIYSSSYSICRNILSACMYMYQKSAWCLWKS